jgi:hypothetical protein
MALEDYPFRRKWARERGTIVSNEPRIFDYRNIIDPATKVGAIAGDVFFVALMIFLLWGAIWPAVLALIVR